MSTKNLARAVIDGDRKYGMARRRRFEHPALRATTRSAVARLDARDADSDDWIIPRPPRIGRRIHDELQPPEHSLDRRVAARSPLPRSERVLIAWLSGRRIGACGETLFWFVPTVRGGYRRFHILDRHEATLWRSLPEWFRACHDPFASAARPAAARVS